MVRRRSTVRFRKGLRRSKIFFEISAVSICCFCDADSGFIGANWPAAGGPDSPGSRCRLRQRAAFPNCWPPGQRSQQWPIPLRSTTPMPVAKMLTGDHNAEYLHLSESGRHCRIEHRSARSGQPQRYPLPPESCGIRRDCSRRGHGDAAVLVDDHWAGTGLHEGSIPAGFQRPLSARAAWVAGPRLGLGPRRPEPRLCALLAARRRCSRR
jgi:hypothetical protein